MCATFYWRAAAFDRGFSPWRWLLLVEVGEVGLDVGHAGFGLLSVFGSEPGEDAQGVLPMVTGKLVLVEGVVGVGKAVVGASLICGLSQVRRELECPVVVGHR